jgi:hypothetical protein
MIREIVVVQAFFLLTSIGLAESPKGLDICGAEFSPGMSRSEVLKRLVLPLTDDERKVRLDGDLIALTPDLFGLPEVSDCGGLLLFHGEKVYEVKKHLLVEKNADVV